MQGHLIHTCIIVGDESLGCSQIPILNILFCIIDQLLFSEFMGKMQYCTNSLK